MPNDRSLLEREMQRVELRPFTLDGFHQRRERRERNRRIRAGVLALVVVAAGAGAFVRAFPSERIPAGDPRLPFLGTWVSTDGDGSTQTMSVGASDDAVEVVIHDDAASVCSGAPSRMTGAGQVDATGELVIPSPVLTCDDGSEPEALSGPPLEQQLRNLTFVLDAETETLTDSFGIVWLREGAEPPTISGGMWPQSSLKEVRQAQELADEGDPNYTWQFGAQVVEETTEVKLELIDRFIHEVLGWDAYLFIEGGNFSDWAGVGLNGWVDGTVTGQRYIRCAPGRTNPLYPPEPGSEQPGESCAPTIDDLHYETVSVDIAQLARQGPDGIWVVSGWGQTAPFAQVDPVALEALARERLEKFLAARIAGNGAEGYVQVDGAETVPLLYATTSGAPYERYEVERVDGPWWPYGGGTFRVRLFAEGDATVTEQEIGWYRTATLSLLANATTENGQPVVLSYTSSDGEVTVSAPSTWRMWWPEAAHVADVGVWFGILWGPGDERVGFVDPVAYDSWCEANGGSPLLSAPADAATIAKQVIADPNFETTAPVAARIGGMDAVSIDVALAPDGRSCGIGMIDISRWIHELWEPGLRLRLYLVDLPKGMSVRTLAITVVAPEERFDEVIAETAPIIDSIEFHAP